MATNDGTVTMAVVPSPPAEPPLAGLIPSLGAPGGPYLDPPDTFDAWNWPAFNPWAEPPARWTVEAVVAAGGTVDGLLTQPATLRRNGVDVVLPGGLVAALDPATDRAIAAAIFAGIIDGRDDKQVTAATFAAMDGGWQALYEHVLSAGADPRAIAAPGYGGAPLFPGDGPVAPRDPRTGVGPDRARWEDGFQYLPEQQCSSGSAQDPCGPTLTGVPAQPSVVKEMPFLVWAGDVCSAFGWQAHDYRGRAIRALLAAESKQIAAEAWKGTRAQAAGWPNAYLASAATTVLAGGAALAPATALDVLEQAIASASNGQRGAIHVTPQLGSYLSGVGQTLRTVNGTILTYRGTVVIPDAGYDGTGPAGQAAAATQWAYATLMPTVRRGEVVVSPDTLGEALDRSTNTVTWRAWRLAAASWSTCVQVAVQVNMAVPASQTSQPPGSSGGGGVAIAI